LPVLVILGGKDVILDSADTKRRLEQQAPGADICFLTDVGHGVFGEERIFRFLTK
jgi:pimeloyl-ACP methyl ester carboxylesterase